MQQGYGGAPPGQQQMMQGGMPPPPPGQPYVYTQGMPPPGRFCTLVHEEKNLNGEF